MTQTKLFLRRFLLGIMTKFKLRPLAIFGVLLGTLLYTPVFASSLLVDTTWLAKHKQAEDVVLIDMSGDPQYQRFHIPGARYLPYQLLNVNTRKRVSLSINTTQLAKLLGHMGISRSSHVVIYDDMGGLNAGRLVWNLEQIGHPKFSVVDGGLVKWILEGRPVTNKPAKFTKTRYEISGQGRNNVATLNDVAPNSRHKTTVLLDVRSQEEFVGNPRHKRSGHIPGAKWWPWDKSVDFDNGFIGKSPTQLKQSLATVGAEQLDTPIILYCRTAHRASQSYLTLRNMGYKNVRVYDGSMLEYEQNKNLPLKIVTPAARPSAN